MAIDMTTVKAISYNNKDVVKIEDGNGNVLWQVPSPSNKFFISKGALQYEVDNNTVSNKTWTGLTSFNGNKIWTDGDTLYYTDATTYELDESTGTWSQTTITSPGTNGNNIWTDGTNIFASVGGTQKVFDKANKTWTNVTWTRSGGQSSDTIGGSNVFKANNKLYLANNTRLYEIDPTNYTYTLVATNFPGAGWAVWTLDGSTYYWSNNGSNYEYDFTTYTKTTKTWTGFTAINGAKIIKYNNEIIAQESSSPYGFYKLDVATSTWSAYTFSGEQITDSMLQHSWNYHGQIKNVNCVAVPNK